MAVFECSKRWIHTCVLILFVFGFVAETRTLPTGAVYDPEEIASMVSMSIRNSTERKLGHLQQGFPSSLCVTG